MTNHQLIALVALDFITAHLSEEKKGSLRFCMLGLDVTLVTAIANAVLDHADLRNQILVKISPEYDPEKLLPENVISHESITYWRHFELPEGKRAVLFVSSNEDFQQNIKSLEKVTKIETDTLKMRLNAWTSNSGLTSVELSEENQAQIKTALFSSITTHAARTIIMFADFVLAISSSVDQGLTLQDSVDNALPALRLPRYSGNFSTIAESKRESLAGWNKIFNKLDKRIRPWIFKENKDGDAIPNDQLRKNYDEIKDRLIEEERHVIEKFIDDDLHYDKWSESQQALVNLDWRQIFELFEGVETRSSTALNELTLKFLDEEFDDILDDDERSLLGRNLPRTPTDDIVNFYESHTNHIARNTSLSTRWERYVYRNPQPYQNFFVGLLATIYALRRSTLDNKLTERKLLVRIPNSHSKGFWREKNAKVMHYFAVRHHGLGKLLGESVQLDFGKLYDYYFPIVDGELEKITRSSKKARSIKFEVIIDPDHANEKLVFYWEMQIDAIALGLPDDLRSVANFSYEFALMTTADIARQSVNTKGSIPRLELTDVNTIRDANDRNEGRLVAPNKYTSNLREIVLNAIEDLNDIIGQDGSQQIKDAVNVFAEKYTEAIRSWIGKDEFGIASDAFIGQVNAYDTLLNSLTNQSEKDLVRQNILHHIIRFGIAEVTAGSPSAIITPWHPLRLAEIGIKARQVANLIKRFLIVEDEELDQAELLFKQVQNEQTAHYYPEVCVGNLQNMNKILLVATDTAYDYTLAEHPTRQSQEFGDDSLDIDPDVVAKAFSRVGEQYLKLIPHEQSNFSVVLYDSESKALPGALISELSTKVEQENELQCDVVLTHSDSRRIRRIYEQQNVAISIDSGTVLASEASRNFLSRLRVGFLDASNLISNGEYREADLVMLHDVVSRKSNLVWRTSPDLIFPDLIEHVPARWSRRKPIGRADTSVSVYLTCPKQPKVGQSYLNFVQNFIYGSSAKKGNVIPAREVDFQDSGINDVFKQTHNIGEWVVNFDELVDRHLLANNGISVIRHIYDRNTKKNTIVSTTTQPKFLRVLINRQLRQFDPNIAQGSEKLVTKLIERANKLSGQVVMRAARYGNYARELLGLVLSMEIIGDQFDEQHNSLGWFFLDDLASWFGQSEEQIADIMAITPLRTDGRNVLKIAISEAKFVNVNDYKPAAKKSAKQLGETIARIDRAIDTDQKRIDRDIWLHRIGDFMIEGMEQFDTSVIGGWNLHQWSEQVRLDNVPIRLEGFSHVFVYDDEQAVTIVGPTPLKGMQNCTQEIFHKHQISDLLRAFSGRELGYHHHNRKAVPGNSSEKSVSVPNNQTVSQEETQISNSKKTTTDVQQDVKKDGDKVFPHEKSADDSTRWASQELAKWVENEQISGEDDSNAEEWLDSTVNDLRRALRGYNMTSELLDTRLTPNAALVHFRGTDELTVSLVERKRQELLTSHAIDVIKVVPAPKEVVIMVARPNRTVLRLQNLWGQRKIQTNTDQSNSSLLLGACESDGNLLYLNVGDEFGGFQLHGPHTLIAGETGSGKGVLVQSLLLDICATNSPNSAQIQMIDPKAGIDYPWLRNMPHLQGGDLITDQATAIDALDNLVFEMERRNKLLAEVGVSKIQQYNAKVELKDRLPRMWLFHDELADWMLMKEYRSAIELNVNRLGVKSRAAGINLVMVTQRPDKDALPMQLRANLTNRLVLKVADKQNSILVLDEPGAERLLGRGHLAARLSGEGKIIYAQVPYASEDEIVELASIVNRAWIA